MNISRLVWNPLYQVLEERIAGGDDILLIVVPYIKLGALERLHSTLGVEKRLKIISRWTLPDLAGGASDLEVYPHLRDRGCEFYVHPKIHLKLYVFRSNLALIASGNLTDSGLGYRQPGNIELGTLAPLLADDWRSLYNLIGDSYRVDDDLYRQMKQHLRSLPQQPSITWPVVVLPSRKKYTIASLPAFETPAAFRSFYFAADKTKYNSEELRRAAHDSALFQVSADLRESQFNDAIGNVFKALPFVVDFVEYLKSRGTLRFGAVTDWIHDKCEDVPLPYRWEIKENTRMLYNWLSHFYREIDWDIPGEYSQVIYWRGPDAVTTQDVNSPTVLDHYQKLFSNLINREQAAEWNEVAIGGAPHQPLLLLAITTLYDRNPGRPNFIELNKALEGLFLYYFSLVVNPPHPTPLVMPFIALREEPFWHLVKRTGKPVETERVRGQATFDDLYKGAKLDESLHRLLGVDETRRVLQQTIIRAHFTEPIRSTLSQAIVRKASDLA